MITNPANTNWNDNRRRGRYGVAFVRSLCAQAGVGFFETPADEDTDAIDAMIKFTRGSVPVQVKCTGQFKVGEGNATLDLDPGWVAKWSAEHIAPYVILVKVPSAVPDWLDHGAGDRTLHRALALATRFDPAHHRTSITFTRADRMSTETLYRWSDDLDAFYGHLAGGAA
ncbi:DUF4365 domain-containing protein [Nocardioides panzhihuensis]|uniref:DUF4365 domain-containing protein n=1 Tax=Nocardioides panzhihuensis TaxID=860243 RepID=A0A7Z0IQP2_9ACTN|nr:DUF4365 domain-containing protein [Nocardioides panzhihuensis]NYI75877.1 hypothetical protein [Nocardioides panzhihuensis]